MAVSARLLLAFCVVFITTGAFACAPPVVEQLPGAAKGWFFSAEPSSPMPVAATRRLADVTAGQQRLGRSVQSSVPGHNTHAPLVDEDGACTCCDDCRCMQCQDDCGCMAHAAIVALPQEDDCCASGFAVSAWVDLPRVAIAFPIYSPPD